MPAETTRVGITFRRRNGTAVERNKLKRQLREALAATTLPAGYDIVAIARPGLREAVDKQGFSWLSELVSELADKLVPDPGAGRST
jgi:ribonuclease P protein component